MIWENFKIGGKRKKTPCESAREAALAAPRLESATLQLHTL